MKIINFKLQIKNFLTLFFILYPLNYFLFSPDSAMAAPADLSKQYGFGNLNTVPDLIAKLLEPAFAVAAIIVVFYFLIGAVKLISSGGDKNAIAGAREMITHAIIGLVLLLMMWIILRFVPEFFGLNINIFHKP